MKLSIILFTACSVLLLGARFAGADEISDLKEQLKALQETTKDLTAKIEALQAKQEVQAKEIKKVPELAQKVTDLKESRLGQLTEGLSIGGHVKLFLFDRTAGKRNGEEQHTVLSSGITSHAFVLYIAKQLNDWLKIDTATDFGVSASATPTLGSNIARATSGTVSTTLRKITLEGVLPYGYEFKAGIFNPMFVEEFAKETFWHEQYHLNDGLCKLESWHDSGVSLYKNFDFPKWSLPVYLEYLNGGASQYVDNNDAKTVLLHIAPELFQTKLRLLGSFAYGRWDEGGNGDTVFGVGGFDWKYQKFNLTSEYIYKKYYQVNTTGKANAPGEREGYYARAMYTFNPTWRVLVKQSHVEDYLTGQINMRSDIYDVTTLGVNYFLTPSSDIIAEYSYIDADRSDGSDKIRANRFTLGFRSTF